MASKENFLNRIATKLGRPRQHDVKKPIWKRNPWDHFHQDLSQQELVNQFENSLQALGGKVIRVRQIDDLHEAIKLWLKEVQVQRVVAWQQDTELGNTLSKSLDQLQSIEITYWNEEGDEASLLQAAERADVGFTIAEKGLSETGTVVLYNRGHQGRSVSLLPTICATVLRAQTIVPRITQALTEMKERSEEYSCINFITGPSRSADIEMDLSTGVHGPGHLVVFLIEDHPE